MRGLNGKASVGDDELRDPQFQGVAQATDAGVTIIMSKAVEMGHNPLAIASGALMAVVRFHAQYLGVVMIEQVMIRIMMPAVRQSVRSLRDSATKPSAPAASDPPRGHG